MGNGPARRQKRHLQMAGGRRTGHAEIGQNALNKPLLTLPVWLSQSGLQVANARQCPQPAQVNFLALPGQCWSNSTAQEEFGYPLSKTSRKPFEYFVEVQSPPQPKQAGKRSGWVHAIRQSTGCLKFPINLPAARSALILQLKACTGDQREPQCA